MIRIGEFARIGGITIKALRHYDAIGLLAPQWVDPATGYRYYAVAQLPRLYRLLAYRDLGLSLDRMRALLDREVDTARLRRALLDKRDELRSRVETGQVQLARIEQLLRLADVGDGATPQQIVIKDVGARRVASVRRRLRDYGELDAVLDGLTAAVRRNHDIVGTGAVWHRCLRDVDGGSPLIDCEALAFVAGDAVQLPECRVFDLPGVRAAALVHHSADELAPGELAMIAETADAHGYEIAWPMREVYFAGEGEGVAGVVEAHFPLQPRRRAGRPPRSRRPSVSSKAP